MVFVPCVMSGDNYSFVVVGCQLFLGRSLWFVICCLLCVKSWPLCVVCRLLFVASCCMVVVRY